MIRTTSHRQTSKATLYSVVFDALAVRYVVAFMFVFFVIQPLAPAFASEDTLTEASSAVEVAEEVDVPPIQEELVPVSENAEDASVVPPSSETLEDFPETIDLNTDTNSDTISTDAVGVSLQSTTTESTSVDAVTPEAGISPIAKGTSSPSGGGVGTGASSTQEVTEPAVLGETTSEVAVENEAFDTVVASTTDIVDAPVFEQPVAPQEENVVTYDSEVVSDAYQPDDKESTPEGPIEPLVETVSPEPFQMFINADNRYQFGESECVDVGNGAFYCSKMVDAKAQQEDGVYVEKDIDGDREIFLRENGKVTQVTNNTFEDGAPSYDKKKGEIVFHRLIEGRYQIMRYIVDSGAEQQLTASHENNMEPTQVDGVVVWQRWVVNNWEIALLQDSVITVLTDNQHHDVAPTIRDGYVMWHTTDASGQKLLSVYDIKNGISSTIADTDGGHVENPRFVLVYDTTFENGDTITKEYDPETGEIKPIGSTSAPSPSEIPPPDSTGEVRALVGIKTTTRDDVVEDFDDADAHTKATSTSPVSVENEETATSTTMVFVHDLNLATTTSDILELTDFDIIVEPYSSTTTVVATSTESKI